MTTYFNTLTEKEKIKQLNKCRFMQKDEFSDGVNELLEKNIVIVGCGAQGLNQGLNMRDSGLNISYVLRQSSIDSKKASYQNAINNGFTVGNFEDLIPNADQRLEAFVDKFLPHCEKMILTLSCYDSDRFYEVQRIHAEERLTIKPWTSELTDLSLARVLSRHRRIYKSLILNQDDKDSCLFKNERIVYKLAI